MILENSRGLDRTDTDISKQVEKSGWYSDESFEASIKENSFTNSLHDFPMARSFSKSYEKTSGTTEFVQQP